MTYLFENDSQRELSQAKRGDKFVVLTTKGQLDYSTVVGVQNNEIKLDNNNSEYIVMINSSLSGDKLSFLDKSKKWHNIKFKRIYIKSAETGEVTIIEPQNISKDEETREMSPEFKNDMSKLWLQAKEEVTQIQPGHKLIITYGTYEFDEEGNYLESAIDTTELVFQALQVHKEKMTMLLQSVRGHENTMTQFLNKKFQINFDRSLFQITSEGIVMTAFHEKGRSVFASLVSIESTKVTKRDELIANDIKESRKVFFKELTSAKKGDTLTMKIGEQNVKSDKYEVSKESVTHIAFTKLGDLTGYIYTKMVSLDGPMSEPLQQYLNEYVYFKTDDDLFTYDEQGVIINALHLNDVFQLKYVFYVVSDNMSDEHDDKQKNMEIPKDSNLDKVGKNKDLMRLLHHKTLGDRLMGRDGVGVIPTDNTEKKLGIGFGNKNHVEFKLLTKDIKIRDGANLHIKQNEPVVGKLFNSGRIIVKSTNGQEEIHLFLDATEKRDIYNVKMMHVSSQGQKHNLGNGRIEMLS